MRRDLAYGLLGAVGSFAVSLPLFAAYHGVTLAAVVERVAPSLPL